MHAPRKTSSSRQQPEKDAAALSIDYHHLLRLCQLNWIWILVPFLLGLVAAYLYSTTQTPIYSARSTIDVGSKQTTVDAIPSVNKADAGSSDLLKTFEQLLQTRNLADRVVTSLHLGDDPDFLGKGGGSMSEESATDELMGMTTIRIRPLTRLIDITVESRSPELAQKLANALAQESIKQEFDQQSGSANELSDYLEKEVTRLDHKVQESEQALQEYKIKEGIPVQESEDVTGPRLRDLNQQYMNAQDQVTLLKERYLEKDPKLIQAEELADQLRNEMSKAQEAALTVDNNSTGYQGLQSVSESYKLQLTNMRKALNDAQVAGNINLPNIFVAEEATLPYAPVRPDKSKELAIGGFGGLLLGFAYVFGLYFVDKSLRSVSQAESTLNVPVIAAVPILPQLAGQGVLPSFTDPHSFVAESIRGLRASLLLHDRSNPLKTILMASAIPGEGKSFCGANLAVAFAQAGLRTLLIDADLRLPTAHTYFDASKFGTSTGFADALSGRADLASAVVQSQVPNLQLLLTTTAIDSPAELLSGMQLPALLDEAARKYDRIVIDSAPLNAVSDTMLIMPKADAILLVIRAAQTPASECKAALEKIYSSKMKPLGLILNYLPPHSLKSYSYGYSYGQKPKDKYGK